MGEEKYDEKKTVFYLYASARVSFVLRRIRSGAVPDRTQGTVFDDYIFFTFISQIPFAFLLKRRADFAILYVTGILSKCGDRRVSFLDRNYYNE